LENAESVKKYWGLDQIDYVHTDTLVEFESKLNFLNKMIIEGLSPKEIKKLVSIDENVNLINSLKKFLQLKKY
jgi:hypothetical protein